MNLPKLSVIVPIWGVEQYIEKCARSIFESDLEDMEIIFVDDCTPDNSMGVLQRVILDYPSRNEQIKFIHHETNKGLPQARKTGYEASRGEWITYVDSDDWIASSMYSKMLNKADLEGYDLVCCDFVYQSDDRVLWKPTYDKTETPSQLRMDLINGCVSNAVWNKIVHRSIYEQNDIYFPTLSMDEDDVFTCQFAYYAKNIGYVHECLYYHYANQSSMTHEKEPQKKLIHLNQQIENRKWIINFLESQKDSQLDNAVFNYKKSVKSMIFCLGEDMSVVRSLYAEINIRMIFDKNNSTKLKLYYLMMLYFPEVLKKIQKV